MTKQDLIKEIANRTELTQKDIVKVVDILPEIIRDTVENDEKVSISGFITFEKVHVAARSGVSRLGDSKGKKWSVPERDEIKVKLSKAYKSLGE